MRVWRSDTLINDQSSQIVIIEIRSGTQPTRGRLPVGTGSNANGQGLKLSWVGAITLGNHKLSQFRVNQNFAHARTSNCYLVLAIRLLPTCFQTLLHYPLIPYSFYSVRFFNGFRFRRMGHATEGCRRRRHCKAGAGAKNQPIFEQSSSYHSRFLVDVVGERETPIC